MKFPTNLTNFITNASWPAYLAASITTALALAWLAGELFIAVVTRL